MIEQTENFPTVHFAAAGPDRIVVHADDVLPSYINLQTRNAVREMHERGFAHDARRRGDTSGHAHANLIQFGISRDDRSLRLSFAFINLRFVTLKFFEDR